MVSLIHLADLHLDTPFSTVKNHIASIRRQDLRDTFAQAVNYAKNSGVKLALLPGDLFDNEYASGSTLSFLVKVMEEAENIRFFVAPGNHDYISRHSAYHAAKFPPNVHIFGSSSVERVDIDEWNLSVYGFAAASPHSSQRMLQNFHVSDSRRINIMAAHLAHTAQPSQEQYYPVTHEDIAGSGLDYLALGHIHKYSGIQKAGETYYAYPGCPEGRGFDECGEKGIIAGLVGKGRCNLSFVPVCKRKYEIIDADFTGVSDHFEAKKRIAGAVGAASEGSLVRIRMTGEVSGEYIPDPAVLWEACDGLFYAELSDCTASGPELSELAAERTLRGMFVKRMLELRGACESEDARLMYDRALRYGLKALSDGEVSGYDN